MTRNVIVSCGIALLLLAPFAVAEAVSVVASGDVIQTRGPLGGSGGCGLPGTAYFEFAGANGTGAGTVVVNGPCFTATDEFEPGQCTGGQNQDIHCSNATSGWRVTLLANGDFEFYAESGFAWYRAVGTLARVE